MPTMPSTRVIPAAPAPGKSTADIAVARELLRMRFSVSVQSLLRRPAGQITTGFALVLLLPAALQIGARGAATALHPPAGVEAASALTATLLLLHLVQIAVLALASGFGIFGDEVPASVLRSLPIPPGALRAVAWTARLTAFPTLAVLLAFAAIGRSFGIVSVAPLALLLLLAVAVSLLLTRIAGLLRGRGAWVAAGLALATAVPLAAAFPSTALASVVSTSRSGPNSMVRLPGDPAPAPSPAAPAILRWSPPGLAAQALLAGRTGNPSGLVSLGLLLGLLGATVSTTASLDRRVVRLAEERTSGTAGHSRAAGASRNAGRFVTDLRLLWRNPSAHVPLREPGMLLLVLAYAWILPNLGPDAVRNLTDLAGMGVIAYALFWQVQLLCNRFGADAGTGATLFSLAGSRTRLLIAKNGALFVLLLAVDAAVVTALALLAQSPRLLPVLLGSLPPLLILATAIGNIVSVVLPFPIARRQEKREPEPDRSLAFVYALFGLGIWGAFIPVLTLVRAEGIALGGLLSAGYLGLVYAASVAIAARVLTANRERRLIAALDGGGG